jgi:hypothetical protein
MAHVTLGPCLNLHIPFFSSKYLANGILSTLIFTTWSRHLEHSCPLDRSHEQERVFGASGSSFGMH